MGIFFVCLHVWDLMTKWLYPSMEWMNSNDESHNQNFNDENLRSLYMSDFAQFFFVGL
jgi:hypothetical protein